MGAKTEEGSRMQYVLIVAIGIICLLLVFLNRRNDNFFLPNIRKKLHNESFATLPQDFLDFSILHTNDLHSHVEGTGPDASPNLARGHFARLAHLIQKYRSVYGTDSTLLFDSGDHFSGTLFHFLSTSHVFKNLPPVELEFLSKMKYDAVTIGNHEFDATEEGFAYLLEKAQRFNLSIPIVQSNMRFTCNGSASVSPLKQFADSSNSVFIRQFLVKEVKDAASQRTLRVGVMGIMGFHAAFASISSRSCANLLGMDDKSTKKQWAELTNRIAEVATTLREKHKADVVVALAHSGYPEDLKIMKEVYKHQAKDQRPLVDLMLSGHTHQAYLRKYQDTYIHQTGAFGMNVGALQLRYDFASRRLHLLNAETSGSFYPDNMQRSALHPALLPVVPSMPFDEEYYDKIQSYKQLINNNLLTEVPYKYNTSIGSLNISFDSKFDLVKSVCDGILQQMRTSETNREAVDLYLTAVGAVRFDVNLLNALRQRNTTIPFQFSDIYRILGVGEVKNILNSNNFDQVGGEPIVHFYITPKDLLTLIDICVWYARFDKISTLTFSNNIDWKESWFGIPFYNRIHSVTIDGRKLESMNYVHIAMPHIVAKYFPKLRALSYGFIDIKVRDQYGRELQTVESLTPIMRSMYKGQFEYNLLAQQLKQAAK